MNLHLNFSATLDRMRAMAAGAVALLPNLLVAIALFVAIAAAASLLKRAVRHSLATRKRTRNVGIVTGRLIQGVALVVAALVALTVVLPNFTPSRAVRALGLGGIAAGSAF